MYSSSFLFLCLVPGYLLLDPLTGGLGVGAALFGSVLWSSKERVVCMFSECCREPYIRANLPGLKDNLRENVFGQHIVIDIVTRSLQAHMKKKEPKKALTLSFHGWTGSGKNFVSSFIAESLFKEGMKSKFVHHFFSSIHFPKEEDSGTYKTSIQQWIRGNVTQCDRSLFIFDEIDKLPHGVIDAIKPFIDYHENVDSVDYRRAVFIFISNTGGKDIAKTTLKHWMSGKPREELTYLHMEEALNSGAFHELGGLQNAELIEKSLVDVFIPFLPLEKVHVKMCIRRELEKRLKVEEEAAALAAGSEGSVPLRTFTEADIDSMANKMNYSPKESLIFSTSGCKKVEQLIDHFLEEDW